MSEFPIDITVRYEDRRFMHEAMFVVRGEARVNGQKACAELIVDAFRGRETFEYDRFTKRVFVRDAEFFEQVLIPQVKHMLMRHIADSYTPRVAVGG